MHSQEDYANYLFFKGLETLFLKNALIQQMFAVVDQMKTLIDENERNL